MKFNMSKNLFSAIMLTASIAVVMPSCKPKDADIQAKVAEAVKSTPGVTVTVEKGVATLTGEVDSEATKAAAETAAKGIKDVTSVVNNLTVTPPAPAPAPVVIAVDDALTTSVKSAIAAFPTVKADVKDGIITLTGDISKAVLPTLIKVMNALHPKKIENKLTIK